MSYVFVPTNNILKTMRAKKVHLLYTAAFSLVIFPGLADAKSRDLYYSRIKPWLENAAPDTEIATETKTIPLHLAEEGKVLPYQKPLPWIKQQNEKRGLPASYVPSFLHQPKQAEVAVVDSTPRPVPLTKAPEQIARDPEPEYVEEKFPLARNEEDPAPEETPRPILLRHRDDVITSKSEEARTAETPIRVELYKVEETAVAIPKATTEQAAPVEAVKSENLAEPEKPAAVISADQPVKLEEIAVEETSIPDISNIETAEAPITAVEPTPTPKKIILKRIDTIAAPVQEPVDVALESVVPQVEQSKLEENQQQAESMLYHEKGAHEDANNDAEGDFDTASNVPANELGEMRGGFIASNGMQINIGLETRTLVDGALAEQTIVKNLENLKTADMQRLVQINNAASSSRKLNLSDVPNIMTIIQNSRNDVKVDSFAIMNIDVSNSARFQLQTMAPEMFNIQAINNLR
ncbi:MAG: hypothetical protein U1E36_00830 [Rickettsiales bacterium]